MLDTFILYVMKTRNKLDYLLANFCPMFSGGQVTFPKLSHEYQNVIKQVGMQSLATIVL